MSIVEELTFTREDCGPAPSTVIAMWLRPSKLIGNVVALSFCAFMGWLLSAVAMSYLLRTARFPAFGHRFARPARSAAGVVSPFLPCSHGRGGITHSAAYRAAGQAGRAKPGLR